MVSSPSRTLVALPPMIDDLVLRKACFGATPKPARETRALPPIEYDFAGVTGFHQFDCFLKLRVGKSVRDDGGNIKTALDHRRHLVPGFVHFAAVNAFNGERAEHHRVPIDRGAAGYNVEKRDFASLKYFWYNG